MVNNWHQKIRVFKNEFEKWSPVRPSKSKCKSQRVKTFQHNIPVWVPDSPKPTSNPATPEKTEMTGRSLPEAWPNIDVDQLSTTSEKLCQRINAPRSLRFRASNFLCLGKRLRKCDIWTAFGSGFVHPRGNPDKTWLKVSPWKPLRPICIVTFGWQPPSTALEFGNYISHTNNWIRHCVTKIPLRYSATSGFNLIFFCTCWSRHALEYRLLQ